MASSLETYDVILIGGAFSGAAAALLLRREMPSLRVLVVEKLAAFDAKVGEATTEMSAMFLTRRLALWQHLEREHLPKEGLRYWSANEKVTGHANASEGGGTLRSTVPSFQLRRDVLDEHLLRCAIEEGAELLRPAVVRDVQIGEFASEVHVVSRSADPSNDLEITRTFRCTWLIDASGSNCFLGRRRGLIDWNDAHPIASIWARWQNVRHIDDIAARVGGAFAAGNIGSRRLATNHYVGRGHWIWVIPLGSGETSIGIVFDKRLHSLHQERDRESTYRTFLLQHPALAELLEGASLSSEDLRGRSRLAYATRQYAGPGWALVGDAAVFIDPYYSPGLDHSAFSVEGTVALILAHARGEARTAVDARIARHNEVFLRSHRWFFDCVYRDKYLLFGEHDLTCASFLLDTSLYYIFVVIPAYRLLKRFTASPVLGARPAMPSYLLLKFMKWRFKRIAARRAQAGEAGLRNDSRRIKAFFDLNLAPFHMAARGARLWLWAEVDAIRLMVKTLRPPRTMPLAGATSAPVSAKAPAA